MYFWGEEKMAIVIVNLIIGEIFKIFELIIFIEIEVKLELVEKIFCVYI